ncbi:hypothetical protein IAU67_08540 [Corynebacterium zhongnanshanii]|nr:MULTISPECIES: hypothetical protein [Corynebacterium]QNP93320.1 hypothetical protein IAU67_08540 [Corynebacterium zhongnanshanii]
MTPTEPITPSLISGSTSIGIPAARATRVDQLRVVKSISPVVDAVVQSTWNPSPSRAAMYPAGPNRTRCVPAGTPFIHMAAGEFAPCSLPVMRSQSGRRSWSTRASRVALVSV